MTPEQFTYWLQGFAELTPKAPSQEQWEAIREHLNLVFDKRTTKVIQLNETAAKAEPKTLAEKVIDKKTPAEFNPKAAEDLLEQIRKAQEKAHDPHRDWPGHPAYPSYPQYPLPGNPMYPRFTLNPDKIDPNKFMC